VIEVIVAISIEAMPNIAMLIRAMPNGVVANGAMPNGVKSKGPGVEDEGALLAMH
jgi:hypothetical protein